jgi:hypothetical protein
MGKTLSVRYALHIEKVSTTEGRNAIWTPQAWRATSRNGLHAHGRPTNANLLRELAFLEASTTPGAVNEHLGVTKILKAHIVDQQTGNTVATYEAAKVMPGQTPYSATETLRLRMGCNSVGNGVLTSVSDWNTWRGRGSIRRL